uniref:Uncharacterized protein n=1 Tax=Tanacetum cinerariifolium TaxID=118510 RepID=A0A6L2L3T5_TANCI|nr:hypothetical protein [Tanacetum cinerariifolium]
MAATNAYKETKGVKVNCTSKDTLQQASTSGTQSDNTPVYDLDGSTEIPKNENCYNHDIFNMLTHEVQYTDLQTELDRTKEKVKNCITKKEKEYVVLWNYWYTKCKECKYDKISYDKAYIDIQQKTEWLQAQLGDLKGKSSDTQCATNTLDLVSQKLKDENVSLEFKVLSYAKENAHLKTIYKNLFDSIKVTQAQTNSIIDSLQKQLYDTIYENAKLRAQLFDKVSELKGTTKGSRTNTMFTKKSILGKPHSSSYKPKLYSVTPFPKFSILPRVDKTNALSKPVTSNVAPATRESKVVQTVNVIAPRILGLILIRPLGVNNTAKTRIPHPRSNSNTDRVPSKSKSSYLSNNVEKIKETHRNLQSYSNQKHMLSECNNITLAIRNAKSKMFVLCVIKTKETSYFYLSDCCSLISSQNQRDLPRNTPLDKVEVLDMIEKRSKVRMGIMPTEIELALEKSHQGVSYEVSDFVLDVHDMYIKYIIVTNISVALEANATLGVKFKTTRDVNLTPGLAFFNLTIVTFVNSIISTFINPTYYISEKKEQIFMIHFKPREHQLQEEEVWADFSCSVPDARTHVIVRQVYPLKCKRPPPAQYLVHQSLATSRRHVAASYWTAASDVAATSAPVNAAGHRSTTVNATGHRSRTVDHGGDRRSTVAVNDGRWWRTTVECRWTTVDLHRTTDQRWLLGRSTSGSRSGLDRVWTGSGSGLPRGMPRVSHVCPRGIHVAADVDIKQQEGVEPGTSWLEF